MSKYFNFERVPLAEVPSRLPILETSTLPVVLVVDDEPVIANTLVAILRKQNYAATAAYNAEDALAVAKIIPPNFLITDILMPKMSGIDLAIAIKESIPDCKILLFSGHTSAIHIEEDPRYAAYDFPMLSKPIHPDALLACIASLGAPVACPTLTGGYLQAH
jgi:DNA-binding NtrC family response regulator